MVYTIAIYCPDQHITYNINTLNEQGVGGGITVRTRIAHALAAAGHQVTLYVNCPRNERIDGVDYVHFSQFKKAIVDIFIASTSGGGLDLTSLSKKQIKARIKILFVHGITKPKGCDELEFDYIYAPSNFISKIVRSEWSTDVRKLFVSYHGVEDSLFDKAEAQRNIYKLIYCSHPSKGLDSAIELFKILHNFDRRFSLDIYGGYRLWGQDNPLEVEEQGCTYHGLIGQPELARCMQKSGFSINLQEREEPFGLTVVESMRAGCIVLASPVGAYSELISDGYNGFLVPGFYTDRETLETAANLVIKLIVNPGFMDYIRRKAMLSSFNMNTVVKTWEGHWDWIIKDSKNDLSCDLLIEGSCSNCKGTLLPLADGFHCIDCGNYQKAF
jgi:glycosyltransferase involved in cell wall biosynthesis